MSTTQTLTQRRVDSGADASSSSSSSTPCSSGPVKVSQGGVVVERVPAHKPPFTVGDIRRAIPAHCFTKPLSKSFGYVFWDLFLVGVIYYASTFIPDLGSEARWGATLAPVVTHALWALYWIAQGCVMTGLWVIGHECGHNGFADNEIINHGVGLIIHSLLLVPYFAWQISHRRHHSNTGSVEHDEVFVPGFATPEQIAERHAKDAKFAHAEVHVHEDEDGFVASTLATLSRLFYIVVMLTLGWPAYLIYNVTGNQSYDPKRWVNHFQPTSPIFLTGSPEGDAHNQKLILLSDVALLAAMGLLYKLVQITSLSYMVYVYFIPYLIVNFWLVLITYLQHTDLALPHYTDGEWDWLRGALATVDRDYGLLNLVLHHITDTHVVHHLFSSMPHYHAEEATRAVIPLLGEYYRYDNTPIHVALWNSFRDCTELYPDQKIKGVHWFEPK